ncbi:ATP-binding protein [Streptomyces nitrosporeus]|uniref:ATP-binding protein n=1 Tax=Streptomyces nitrosporeus TaxID=28894 RepID=A0A5J6F6Z8_9ACTN|nr:ATP-binding protein [Streptomyces nitrosporeus]QEU71424.1 ATP-binding protein [Streptomyces nitrosporeus]
MAGDAAPRGRSRPERLYRRVGHTDLSAVGEVRGELRRFLRHRSGPEETDTAELLLSELVTNALIHTRNGAAVTVTSAPGRLRVEVRDFMTEGQPAPYVPNADDGTHGRGLLLVQSLADSWGVLAQTLGKVVWFELTGGRA